MYDKRFNKILDCVLEIEKGYVNDKDDAGGPTNYGITHTTYDSWNRRHNKPIKNVKDITFDEAKEIYYHDYWIRTGANKIKDIRLAYCYFDMAVNSGEGYARDELKKSGGDFDKFVENREKFYNWCAENRAEDKNHIEGWENRLKKLKTNAAKLYADEKEEIMKEVGNIPYNYTPEVIQKMSQNEYERNRKNIEKELKERREKIQKLRDYGYDTKPIIKSLSKPSLIGFTASIPNNKTNNSSSNQNDKKHESSTDKISDNSSKCVNFNGISYNGKPWNNWSEGEQRGFLEGFIGKSFASIDNKKKGHWTDKFNIGNPNTDDGHWVTLDNGKHLFIKDA